MFASLSCWFCTQRHILKIIQTETDTLLHNYVIYQFLDYDIIIHWIKSDSCLPPYWITVSWTSQWGVRPTVCSPKCIPTHPLGRTSHCIGVRGHHCLKVVPHYKAFVGLDGHLISITERFDMSFGGFFKVFIMAGHVGPRRATQMELSPGLVVFSSPAEDADDNYEDDE